MSGSLLGTFITFLAYALWLAILGRVITSWINVSPSNPIVTALYQMTEPILAPIRRVLPQTGMIDLSPMVAILIIFVILQVVSRAL